MTERAAALEDAGCTLQSFPALPNKSDHSDVPTLTTKPKWNSMPPTSGPHYGSPAVWGFYDEPIPLVQTRHNLEHGGVVIHYGPDVPEAEVDALRDVVHGRRPERPRHRAPSPRTGTRSRFSAGPRPTPRPEHATDGRGWLATCTKFDEGAFSAFIDEHRYKGPERLPPELVSSRLLEPPTRPGWRNWQTRPT